MTGEPCDRYMGLSTGRSSLPKVRGKGFCLLQRKPLAFPVRTSRNRLITFLPNGTFSEHTCRGRPALRTTQKVGVGLNEPNQPRDTRLLKPKRKGPAQSWSGEVRLGSPSPICSHPVGLRPRAFAVPKGLLLQTHAAVHGWTGRPAPSARQETARLGRKGRHHGIVNKDQWVSRKPLAPGVGVTG